jgi:hypothetical protein
VSVKENIDDTPAGQLQFTILAGIAEFYSTNNGAEALKGMTQKARVGGTPGMAPIGYLNVREIVDGREIRTVAVDPDRAPLIQWAFQAYATGEYTVSQLAEEMARRGLRSLRRRKMPAKPCRSLGSQRCSTTGITWVSFRSVAKSTQGAMSRSSLRRSSRASRTFCPDADTRVKSNAITSTT